MACADPGARLGDFEKRVVDANTDTVDAEVLTSIPDVSGDFLLALNPSAFPGSLFKFRANVELIDGTTDEPKIRLQLFPLDARNNVEIGEAIATDPEIMPVSMTGEFTGAVRAETPGKTNPVSGTALTVDMTLRGIIRNADHFCGAADGQVVAPFTLDMNGSSFGAVRIPVDGSANDVEPAGSCLASPDDSDAGPSDAGTADAGVGDGGSGND